MAGLIELRHAWAVDIDADSCVTYEKNIPGASSETVKNLDVRLALEALDTYEDIDGFAFGFPCNDFSLVGQQKGLLGDFGGLYQAGVDVLRRKQPHWFVAENVGGLRSANGGRAFEQILSDLQAVGYRVTPHLYRFEQYGVPQTRHRVILVGIHEDEPHEFKVPAPTHGPGTDSAFKSAGQAISRPFAIDQPITNHEKTRQSARVVERLKLIDPGENAFNAMRMTDDLRLNVKGATLSHIYKRLEFDKPSYTVTGSGGGGTHVYHWSEHRALTNRERARLQTFPDDFTFFGSRDSVRKQVGMAVPVDGSAAIFTALFKSLAGIEYRSVEANLMDRLEKSRSLTPTVKTNRAPH